MSFAAIDVAGGSEASTGRGYTGLDGNVTFRVLPDEYQFPPEILGEADDHITVFCAGRDELQVPLDYPIEVTARDHIVCDNYLLPAEPDVGHDVTSLTISVFECSETDCDQPVEGQLVFVGHGSDQINLTTDANGWARADVSGINTEFIPFSPQLRGDIEREIECWSASGPLAVDTADWASWAVYYTFYPPEGENVSCKIVIQASGEIPATNP